MPDPRTWLVTGAASGIGAALVEAVRADGDRVIGVDREGADVAADLGTPGGRRAVVDAVATAVPDGTLDAVVACAGIASARRETVSVNHFGVTHVLEGLQPHLARSPAGRVVALSSVAATYEVDDELVELCLADDETAAVARSGALLDHDRGRTLYASSKRALSSWVRREAVADRWAGTGIAVNAVAPGIVRTPMMARPLGDDERRRELERSIPMPLTGGPCEPEDVVEVLRWLAGDHNRLVTGQVIFADGGTEAVRRGATHV